MNTVTEVGGQINNEREMMNEESQNEVDSHRI